MFFLFLTVCLFVTKGAFDWSDLAALDPGPCVRSSGSWPGESCHRTSMPSSWVVARELSNAGIISTNKLFTSRRIAPHVLLAFVSV